MSKTLSLNAKEHRLILGEKTCIMGIVNVTPDSFSGDGHLKGAHYKENAVRSALKLIRDGADIIDVGGESTRPGADKVSVLEETARVVPTIKALKAKVSVPISVDSYKLDVIHAALDAGADIINVIQGTPINTRIISLARRYQAALVLMHMRGTPRTMQQKTKYKDLTRDVYAEIQKSVEKCLEQGITKDRIIVDPGIGFSKTAEQNLVLLRELSLFSRLGCPVLVGPSRKSFIGKVLGVDVAERSMGTAAAVALSIAHGAHIVRVHDVREMKQVTMMSDAILTASGRS
jgi:dihydropteroate synthase